MMELESLLETYVATGQKIDVLWNFFVTIHLAILGTLVYADDARLRSQSPSILTVLAVAYIVFSVINFRAKTMEYRLMQATRDAIVSLHENAALTQTYFQSVHFGDRGAINISVHVGAFLAILFIIWKIRRA